ncbi:MAG TPA: thioredoxin domain-containing protein [Vicinamibacteria bacterium]|nr:thioredoxin domain-containing protein [Vicinamibacteria bacterium]
MKLARLALPSVLACLVLPACARNTVAETKPETTTKPVQGPGSVVASVDGAPITFEEMEERAAGRLYGLRQEEYDARRGAIEEIVYERLLQAEAKRRGVNVEALEKAEVTDKIAPVTPADIDAAYQGAKARLGGRTKEQVAPDIERALRQQREAQRRTELRDRLLGAAKVSVSLAAPRVNIELPASTPAVGPADAPVTLVEFSDYQCPYCHRAQASVDEVLKRYAGRVRFVHQEYPLAQHPRAFAAAVAARCANEQGRFWDFHRSLMTEPGDFADADLKRRADQFGMDSAKLQACVASGRFDGDVNKAFSSGAAIGVNSTPTFFVNGRRLTGAVPFETLQTVIDEELVRPQGS